MQYIYNRLLTYHIHSLIRGIHYDVAIIGGGIMGLSSAFFISKRLPSSSICVLERDTTYSLASTPRSVGSIRQQFSLSENIQLSSYSFGFFRNINRHLRVDEPIDIGLVEGGYCFLATEQGRQVLLENNSIQLENGAEVELIESSRLKERFPWINTEGISLASLGVGKEGWFDSWSLLNAFKNKLTSLAVNIINGDVIKIESSGNIISGVEFRSNGVSSHITCSHLVAAAGAWSNSMVKLISPDLCVPIRPRKRCVFVFKCKDIPEANYPMLIDCSGVYSRREITRDTFICGKSPNPDQDPDTFDIEVDYGIFDREIWHALAHRVPAFEAIKLVSAWAGTYEYNTFDQNGIIGRHDVFNNLCMVGGFSGHGIQQSPGVGRAVSEIVLDGESHSIDLKRMGWERVRDNKPIKERNII